MQLRMVPLARPCHRQSDRLPGTNDDVHISTIWSGPIHAASVEFHGIELHNFIAGPHPIERSLLLSPEARGRHGDQKPQQKQVSHIRRVFRRSKLGGNVKSPFSVTSVPEIVPAIGMEKTWKQRR